MTSHNWDRHECVYNNLRFASSSWLNVTLMLFYIYVFVGNGVLGHPGIGEQHLQVRVNTFWWRYWWRCCTCGNSLQVQKSETKIRQSKKSCPPTILQPFQQNAKRLVECWREAWSFAAIQATVAATAYSTPDPLFLESYSGRDNSRHPVGPKWANQHFLAQKEPQRDLGP